MQLGKTEGLPVAGKSFQSFDGATFDGTVGVPADCDPSPPPRAAGGPLLVSVDAVLEADPRAVGLAEDIRLFIQAFLLDADAVRTSRACAAGSEPDDASDDVEIAIHGLTLEPDAEAELHQRIQGLVRRRLRRAEESR